MKLSTREELIPSLPGRPAVIEQDGWKVFLSVHDKEYLRAKKQMRKEVLDLHPDKSGLSPEDPRWERVNQRFRSANLSYIVWCRKERCWYWKFGLMPPDWKGAPQPPQGWRVSRNRRIEG